MSDSNSDAIGASLKGPRIESVITKTLSLVDSEDSKEGAVSSVITSSTNSGDSTEITEAARGL